MMPDVKVGDTFQAAVTVRKVKNGVPTVITIDGREYIYRPPTIRPPAKGAKKS